MSGDQLKLLARISALNAYIASFNAANALSLHNGEPPYYTEDHFTAIAAELEEISNG